MCRLAVLLLAGALTAATLTPASALEPRAEAVVDGDVIRLGDLFDGLAPEIAAKPLTSAPAPGRWVSYDATALLRIATAHGIAWRPATLNEKVTVTRAAQEIGPERLRDALTQAAIAAGAPASAVVTLDNQRLTLALPANQDGSFDVRNVAYDAQRGRLTADIVAPAYGIPALRQTVGARVQDMAEVPVLTRRLAPGEVIGPADIAWVKIARDRLPAGVALSASDLEGLSPRRAVAPNQPVRTADVRLPIVVAKGQVVTLMLQSPMMTLTAQGRALDDAGLGEPVRVVNTSSNRTIEATAAGTGLVTVVAPGLGMPIALPTPQKVRPGTVRTAFNNR